MHGTVQRPTWLGNFFGSNLGFLNYEIATIERMPLAELKQEAELMTVKWFDYRRLHPLQATYYFSKCYLDAYRSFCKMAVNAQTAEYARYIKEHDFLLAKERKSIWKLRQLCDRMGIRYDFFLGFAMRHHHRMVSDGGKVYPPRPAHVLNNDELIVDAALAWEELQSVSMQVARDPYYRVSNFAGHKNQLAHEAFVIAQINARRHKQYSLHAALYLYDAVRIEEAMRHFGQELVSMAIDEVQVP